MKFRFQDLKVWQLAIEIANELFDIADELEKRRFYRFAEQLRGAAMSMSNNIAEGSGSNSKREFIQFLNMPFVLCSMPFALCFLSFSTPQLFNSSTALRGGAVRMKIVRKESRADLTLYMHSEQKMCCVDRKLPMSTYSRRDSGWVENKIGGLKIARHTGLWSY